MLQNKLTEQSACSSVSMDHDVTKQINRQNGQHVVLCPWTMMLQNKSTERSACSSVSMDHDVTKQI